MEKKLYEMDLAAEDFECGFEDECDGREGRFITMEEYDGFHKYWYDPQGYRDKLIQRFEDYSYEIKDILERGVKPEDLSYLLELDVKLFNTFYLYTCEEFDASCFDSRRIEGVDEIDNQDYQFYFDDDEYKNLRLF